MGSAIVADGQVRLAAGNDLNIKAGVKEIDMNDDAFTKNIKLSLTKTTGQIYRELSRAEKLAYWISIAMVLALIGTFIIAGILP